MQVVGVVDEAAMEARRLAVVQLKRVEALARVARVKAKQDRAEMARLPHLRRHLRQFTLAAMRQFTLVGV
jgi:hypothetical protein